MDLSVNKKTILLSNLTFDHPLSSHEINDLINMLSSGVSIGQIYFKDSIDINSIEKVKLLLEGLPNIDDKKIEKYIMKAIDKDEKATLDKISFQNIETWNIAYSIENNKFSVTTLSKYRLIDEWFNNSIKEMGHELSTLEKICYLYDKIKLFEFDSNPKYGRLPEIISCGTANSYGYNLLFKELLSMCKIPCIIGSYIIDGETNFITLAEIKDYKYDVTGIYFFEPSMDTISKEQYKHGLARRMNYNFFAITANKFSKLDGQVIPQKILKVLLSEDNMEYKHNLNNYNRKFGSSEIINLENIFKTDIDEVYSEIFNGSNITNETIFDVFSNRVDSFCRNEDERENIKKTIISNYLDREDQLFLQKNVKHMSKKDILNT